MGLMQSMNPDSVTVAFRLALMHFAKVSRRLQMVDVVKTAEMELAPRERAVAKDQVITAPE